MQDRWKFLPVVDDLIADAEAVRDAIDDFIEVHADIREKVDAGVSIVDWFETEGKASTDVRVSVQGAISEFETSVAEVRGIVARHLIHEVGLSQKAFAHRIGVSRQMVAKIVANTPRPNGVGARTRLRRGMQHRSY